MRKLAIDFTYEPTGGSHVQIKKIIEYIDNYNFSEIIFYLTKQNLYLLNDINNLKVKRHIVFFSNAIDRCHDNVLGRPGVRYWAMFAIDSYHEYVPGKYGVRSWAVFALETWARCRIDKKRYQQSVP